MHYRIRHQLAYQYSNSVALDPQRLYLQPKQTAFQRTEEFRLGIFPENAKVVCNTDAEGNTQHLAFFKHPTTELTLVAESIVETTQSNPFDFILYPFDAQKLPLKYSDAERRLLGAYFEKEGITPHVEQFARLVATENRWDTLRFLMGLNEAIHGFSYEIREEGAPQAADVTLGARKGSCRDYTVLFMTCCRAFGIPARFVSGYYFGGAEGAQYLHAWVEVYLPGAGWRGFDPTQNCLAADTHIVLATSAIPEMITPVSGTYWGQAESGLEVQVAITPMVYSLNN